MTLRIQVAALGALILLCGCHGQLASETERSDVAATTPAAPSIPAGHAAIHVHEVENSETGIEIKWSIDGTGAANGSNTTTTKTTGEQPFCIAISPSDSQKFHCEVTVRAQAGEKNKIQCSQRVLTAIDGSTRVYSDDWTASGKLRSSFKSMVMKDVQFETPKQLVLATLAGKPVSVRIGD